MRQKTKRLRGSKSHGRGWKSSKHKGGSRGGTGRAGLETHKRISAILELKKPKLVTCIRDIESKLTRLIKKKYVLVNKKNQVPEYIFQKKFTKKYGKILSQGQPSGKYVFSTKIKLTANTKLKTK